LKIFEQAVIPLSQKMKSFIKKLIKLSVTRLPKDVEKKICEAYKNETSVIGKRVIKQLIGNIKIAENNNKPICQDTGIPLFFVEGKMPKGFQKTASHAVKECTDEGFLRPNIVDPITRKNIGNAGMGFPYIYYFPKEVDYSLVIFCPKGGGSENMSKLAMLKPSQGIKGIKNFVIKSVAEAGANPCPPLIIGVGIGGSADLAMKLAKKAILRNLDKKNSDLEIELKNKINRLGIGPMGLGGKTTALAVNIEQMGCNTNGLPVGVNIQCWCARKAVGKIEGNKFSIISH